jgi:metallo-beta-lactamase family protein
MVKGDLYLQKDVEDTMSNFVTLQFNRRFKVKDGVWVTFVPAGHLLVQPT